MRMNFTNLTDGELLALLAKDDTAELSEVFKKALDTVFLRYHETIRLKVRRTLNDQSQVDDVIQDMFIKLMEFKKWGGVETLHPFLLTTARNGAFRKNRHAEIKRRLEDMLQHVYEGSVIDLDSRDGQSLIRECYKRLKLLSKESKRAFWLVYIEGYKYKQAAEEMNVTINTIKTLLRYAKKKLRELPPPSSL